MSKLTVLQLARQYLPVYNRYNADDVLLGSGDGLASLTYRKDHVALVYQPGLLYHDRVLHELCHALVGPSSFRNEWALMALQWKLMAKLRKSDYAFCREEFGGYGLGFLPGVGWRDIGNTDDFLKLGIWKRGYNEACKSGLLTKKGEIPKRLKVHCDWGQFAEKHGNPLDHS